MTQAATKSLTNAPMRMWTSTSDPGASEPLVEIGNWWRNTASNAIFCCHNDQSGSQVWNKYAPSVGITSFTPAISGTSSAGVGTYTTQKGYYSQVDSLVFGWINLAWTATTGTGNTLITGLPFSANSNVIPVVNFQFENITLPIGGLFLNGKLSGTQIAVVSPLTAAGATALLLPASGTLQASFFYST